MSSRKWLAAFGLLVGGMLNSPAAADGPPVHTSVASAKALMQSGRSAEARQLLQELATRNPRSNDIDFLLGLLAVQSSDYDTAVDHFRSILVRSPNAVRVRLELGRTFFLKHDYENAFRQFQFARAGKLPRGVGSSIDRYVAAIRKQVGGSETAKLLAGTIFLLQGLNLLPDSFRAAGPNGPSLARLA